MIIGLRQPNPVPEFGWLNTILGNLKTRFSGTYHAFDFAKYGSRYLAAFADRASTGGFISTRFPPTCSPPPPPSDHALPVGSVGLKNLAKLAGATSTSVTPRVSITPPSGWSRLESDSIGRPLAPMAVL